MVAPLSTELAKLIRAVHSGVSRGLAAPAWSEAGLVLNHTVMTDPLVVASVSIGPAELLWTLHGHVSH